jgi:hypothetical protein
MSARLRANALDDDWRIHLYYLRGLQRVGSDSLAAEGTPWHLSSHT